MGVLTDYFRAPDAGAVVAFLTSSEAASPVAEFDGVEAKSIDPHVVLGLLVAVAAGEPYQGLASRPVWPATPEPTGYPDDGDPWADGPWVFELDTRVRDVIADVNEVTAVVTEWARAEEVGGSPSDWEPVVGELVALAGRARSAGQRLYCWTCL
ncbi:hypothetical protein V5P93_003997 [Actinokineospora auranticolor]|uniref:Uncharacterized protein n=1 Tax=Actinokineospora auranticolor TaxID=155976 RepID=A0A2S6GCM7_9PSEU|nr:hypothetical protein [Actinokineospora auranticolor]PPK62742.1 hypothetical protein CLV40_1338 [Actinokineospora auranticolor]